MKNNKNPDVKDLPLIEDFKEARESLEQSVLTSESLKGRANTFFHVSQLYKTIAENTQDTKIKESATEEAQYFLTEAFKYRNQYETQKLMLPGQFNADSAMPSSNQS